MAKNINLFMRELADYINTNIAGTENTYILKCTVPDGMVVNRGHAIIITVKMPDGMEKEFSNYGPCFYAEELLNEFPNNTVATIGEIINSRVTEVYPDLIKVMAEQKRNMEKGIKECNKNEIIITAIPSRFIPEAAKKNDMFVTKEFPSLGLSAMMKVRLCEKSGTDNSSYFSPVCKKEGQEVTYKDWHTAELNSIRQADIQNKFFPLPEELRQVAGPNICGHIEDYHGFYDWFYLISPMIWHNVIPHIKAGKIFIIPGGPYFANYVIDHPAVWKNPETHSFAADFVDVAIKASDRSMPAFVLDCDTLEIRKLNN